MINSTKDNRGKTIEVTDSVAGSNRDSYDIVKANAATKAMQHAEYINKNRYGIFWKTPLIFFIYVYKYLLGSLSDGVPIGNIQENWFKVVCKAANDIPDSFIIVVIILFFFGFIKDYLFANIIKNITDKFNH